MSRTHESEIMSKSKNVAKPVQSTAAAFPFPTAKAMKAQAKVATKEAEAARKADNERAAAQARAAVIEAKKIKPIANAIAAVQDAFVKANLETEVKRLVLEIPDFPSGQLIETATANLKAESTPFNERMTLKFQDLPLLMTFYVDGETMVKVGNTSAISGFHARARLTTISAPADINNKSLVKLRLRKTADVQVDVICIGRNDLGLGPESNPTAFFSPERRAAWDAHDADAEDEVSEDIL